ncbi:phosphoribosyltransferase [Chondromyces apiculatus]|uniref:Phosphoribosyltransferase n=1 Tax=Chondromyces apiculatus DSM 436 TaxID=1192034 RepID=A0A017SWM9_9BACT|nr:phosphoribosyltransferase [Chondromyces apiculatus]EYF01374.1 phosphoribosyltransferase [Chondromyces apiculatus DSM 436]
MRFQDRADAGRQLAARLAHLRPQNPLVVALPRGGVPVGCEIARALGAPLDVLIARKIGAPGHAELGIGAVAQGGAFYLNAETVAMLGVTREYIEGVARSEFAEIDRRLKAYRGDRPPLDVYGRVVILVDDGLATGATTRAAIRSLRKQVPKSLVLAVPVCAADTAADVRREVDDVVCTMIPASFQAVGLWYRDFTQTSDEEVVDLLTQMGRSQRGDVEVQRRPEVPETYPSRM